jgi:hypothetical protein
MGGPPIPRQPVGTSSKNQVALPGAFFAFPIPGETPTRAGPHGRTGRAAAPRNAPAPCPTGIRILPCRGPGNWGNAGWKEERGGVASRRPPTGDATTVTCGRNRDATGQRRERGSGAGAAWPGRIPAASPLRPACRRSPFPLPRPERNHPDKEPAWAAPAAPGSCRDLQHSGPESGILRQRPSRPDGGVPQPPGASAGDPAGDRGGAAARRLRPAARPPCPGSGRGGGCGAAPAPAQGEGEAALDVRRWRRIFRDSGPG